MLILNQRVQEKANHLRVLIRSRYINGWLARISSSNSLNYGLEQIRNIHETTNKGMDGVLIKNLRCTLILLECGVKVDLLGDLIFWKWGDRIAIS